MNFGGEVGTVIPELCRGKRCSCRASAEYSRGLRERADFSCWDSKGGGRAIYLFVGVGVQVSVMITQLAVSSRPA